MSHFPELFTIGSAGRFIKADPALEYDGDPRGFVWIWEPPNKGNTYVLGCDVAVGRTGWSRYNRTKEDHRTDNGAIEIVKIGKDGKPDQQVAEYAAPVDPFELGDIANMLGRLYAGTEDDQCKCIIEVHPGPGFGTLQRMLESGYTNHFRWEYYADSPATPTRGLSFGWSASPRTNRDLWVKASRHINLRSAIVRSPWLQQEFADSRWNPDKQIGENPSGHDDRVRAFNLAVWLANGWSLSVERTSEPVNKAVTPANWGATDMTIDEIHEAWGRLWN